MPPSRAQIAVGGMWVNVYGLSELLSSGCKEAVVLFFLHGRCVCHPVVDDSHHKLTTCSLFPVLFHPAAFSRFGSAERIEHIVHKTYDDTIALIKQEASSSSSSSSSTAGSSDHLRGLIIVVCRFFALSALAPPCHVIYVDKRSAFYDIPYHLPRTAPHSQLTTYVLSLSLLLSEVQ